MRVTVRATRAGTVGYLDKTKPHLTLMTDTQDVESVKDYFGNRPAVEDFDGFLVNIEDGEYTEVYGFAGNIAYTYKPVYRITRTFSDNPKPKYAASRKAKSGKSKPRRTDTTIGRVR